MWWYFRSSFVCNGHALLFLVYLLQCALYNVFPTVWVFHRLNLIVATFYGRDMLIIIIVTIKQARNACSRME